MRSFPRKRDLLSFCSPTRFSVCIYTGGVFVFVSPTGQHQVHVPSIEQRRSKRILTRCSVWKLFWYLAYRDANRVKFNFDLLLGNVEPKTFLPLSLSFSFSFSCSSVRSAGQSLLLESPPSFLAVDSPWLVYKYR